MIAAIKTDVPKLLLPFSEAAEALSCSEKTVARLAKSGAIPTVRLGKLVRISTVALQRFIEQQEGTNA